MRRGGYGISELKWLACLAYTAFVAAPFVLTAPSLWRGRETHRRYLLRSDLHTVAAVFAISALLNDWALGGTRIPLAILVGYTVRFMYRETPDNETDSGWRFFSGNEDDAYTSNADNHGIYDVNTIANYDPSIISLLDSQGGSAFEKALDAQSFSQALDWFPEEQ